MRFPIYSHDSNPRIDHWLSKKSLTYIEALFADGLAAPIYDVGGKLIGAHCLPPEELREVASVDELLLSSDDCGAIDEVESKHNATGLADRVKRALICAEMRAINKVRGYGPPSWAYRGKKQGFGLTVDEVTGQA